MKNSVFSSIVNGIIVGAVAGVGCYYLKKADDENVKRKVSEYIDSLEEDYIGQIYETIFSFNLNEFEDYAEFEKIVSIAIDKSAAEAMNADVNLAIKRGKLDRVPYYAVTHELAKEKISDILKKYNIVDVLNEYYHMSARDRRQFRKEHVTDGEEF